MDVERSNPFDVGVKYGAVGRGVSNAISEYLKTSAEEKGSAELDRLMQEYNNPQSTIFAGMTPSGRAYKMSRLTAQIDPEASKRYETISAQMKQKEQEQGVNKGISDAYTNSNGDKYLDANAKLMETDAKSAIDNLEAQKKANMTKQSDLKALLPVVASYFAGIDPNDQNAWDQERVRWIEQNDGLSSFIPEQANQANWDRIQSQGGKKENVAPKGEYATNKSKEDQISKLSFLSKNARDAGLNSDADTYAREAIKLQKQLSGETETNRASVGDALSKYKTDIDILRSFVTMDTIPATFDLQAKIESDIGEGAVSNSVISQVKDILSKDQSNKKDAFQRSQGIKDKAQSTTSINAEKALDAAEQLKQNPTDRAAKENALLVLLRAETGAAIGKNEAVNRLTTVLNDGSARKLRDDQSHLLAWAASKSITDDQFMSNIINEYIDSVDMRKLRNTLLLSGGKKSAEVNKPNQKQESNLDKIRRMRGK